MLCGPRVPLTLVADLGAGQVMHVWRGYKRLELLGHDFHLDSTRRPCEGQMMCVRVRVSTGGL